MKNGFIIIVARGEFGGDEAIVRAASGGILSKSICAARLKRTKEEDMPGYISLLKFTPKALADLKGSPDRINEAKAAAQKMGIKWVGFWATMGEYDAISIVDAPNDEAASALALAIASKGYVTTQGMRAYSETEWAALVKKLP